MVKTEIPEATIITIKPTIDLETTPDTDGPTKITGQVTDNNHTPLEDPNRIKTSNTGSPITKMTNTNETDSKTGNLTIGTIKAEEITISEIINPTAEKNR